MACGERVLAIVPNCGPLPVCSCSWSAGVWGAALASKPLRPLLLLDRCQHSWCTGSCAAGCLARRDRP